MEDVLEFRNFVYDFPGLGKILEGAPNISACADIGMSKPMKRAQPGSEDRYWRKRNGLIQSNMKAGNIFNFIYFLKCILNLMAKTFSIRQ